MRAGSRIYRKTGVDIGGGALLSEYPAQAATVLGRHLQIASGSLK